MKKLIAAMLLLLCCSEMMGNGGPSFLCKRIFSELYVYEGGWVLELNRPKCWGSYLIIGPVGSGDPEPMSLDEFSISSLADTAEFVQGLMINYDQPILIAQSDLVSQLYINPAGDIITIYQDGYMKDWVAFGDVSNADVSALNGYQSVVSLSWEGHSMGWNYYYRFMAKESPPTLGSNPWEVLSLGILEGYVFDMNDNPKPNAHLYFMDFYNDDNVYFTALTNPDGYFSVSDVLAHLYSNTMVEYDGEWYGPFPVAVEPDTTSYVEIHTITTGLGGKIPQITASPPWFYNYPNPVSSYTIFSITLPEEYEFSSANIIIINPNGQFIDKILVEGSPGGCQQVHWDASSLASGAYLLTLEVEGKIVASNKMTVVR
jgi:hypothetical protein